jgi:hypothetical protein
MIVSIFSLLRWRKKLRTIKYGFVLTVIGILVIYASSSVFVNAADCDDVLSIHLRGSGQNDNIDVSNSQPEAITFFNELKNKMGQDISIRTESMNYPAWKTNMQFMWAEFDPGNKNNDGYFMSKNTGTTMLKDRLEIAHAACPNQRIVVSGYSQGSHAIGDALKDIPENIQNQIDYIGLFGDPRFNPDSYAARGNFKKKEYFGRSGGILEVRDEFAESYRGKINSFCLHDDGICENRYSKIKHGKHGEYPAEYVPTAAKEAAGRVAQSLLKRSSESSEPEQQLQPEAINTLNSIVTKPTDIVFIVDRNGQLSGYKYSNYLHYLNPEAIISNPLIRSSGTNSGLILLRDLAGNEYNTHADIRMNLSYNPEELESMKTYIGPTASLFNYTAPLLDGILVATDQMTWRNDVARHIIVITDEDTTDVSSDGRDIHEVISYIKQKNIEVSVVTAEMVEPYLMEYQNPEKNKEIVTEDGYYIFSEYDSSTQGVIEILNNIRTAPAVTMNAGSYATPLNETVYFSVANSAPQPGTSIASYKWDFDGNGTIDTTTTTPIASYSYDTEGSYSGKVTVNADTGSYRQSNFTVVVSETFRTSLPKSPPPLDSSKFFNLENTNEISDPVGRENKDHGPLHRIFTFVSNVLSTQTVSAQSEDQGSEKISVYSLHDQDGRLLRLISVEDFPVEIPSEIIVTNSRIGIAAHNDFGGSPISYHTITASEKTKAEKKADPKKVELLISSRDNSQLHTNENSDQPVEVGSPNEPSYKITDDDSFVINPENNNRKEAEIPGNVLGDKNENKSGEMYHTNKMILTLGILSGFAVAAVLITYVRRSKKN